MKTDARPILLPILLWGAIWGLAEATLGFALHVAAVALPGLPGFLMFPVAASFLERAVRASGRASAAFGASVVAAAVKLTGLAVPGADPIRVLNPALSILLEGLAVAALFAVFARAGREPGLLGALAAGIAWRGAFCLHLWLLSAFDLPAGLVTSGAATLLRFLVGESLANGVLISVLYRALRRLPSRTTGTVPSPGRRRAAFVAAAAALAAAVAATVLL
jgi:hypothetical protein